MHCPPLGHENHIPGGWTASPQRGVSLCTMDKSPQSWLQGGLLEPAPTEAPLTRRLLATQSGPEQPPHPPSDKRCVCKRLKAPKGRGPRGKPSVQKPFVSSPFLPPVTQENESAQLQVHIRKKAPMVRWALF